MSLSYITLSLLPALSLSATELLLEPSGGKAILIDTNLVAKRSSGALTPSDPPKVSANNDEDEIPQVDKRAAILLDKIMYAVQKALDEDTKKGRISNGHPNLASFTGGRQTSGLDNKVYWKCYFNAVSCF